MNKNIIFFDGVCGLCNGFVDFIMKIDHKNVFLFSPLQSQTAKDLLTEEYTSNLKTIVYFENGELYTQSDAVIKVLTKLSFPWSLGVLLKVFPKFFRNFIYHLISTKRYQIFGKQESCRLPSPEEREKFLP